MTLERPTIGQVRPAAGPATTQAPARAGDAAAGFDRVLADKLREPQSPGALKWSAHAVQRLSQRQIAITPETQKRIEGAVDRLASKGGRESVVLVDKMAFVVSVPNRTVITAVDQAGMKDQVFTNIDSAVVG
jgi:flagellar operon protein